MTKARFIINPVNYSGAYKSFNCIHPLNEKANEMMDERYGCLLVHKQSGRVEGLKPNALSGTKSPAEQSEVKTVRDNSKILSGADYHRDDCECEQCNPPHPMSKHYGHPHKE